MNKLLHLLFIDIKLLSKTKVFYLKLILFPCVLILLLGNLFGTSNSKLTRFDVAFYTEDGAITQNSKPIGETLRDDVLKSDAVKALFNLQEVNSYNEGEQLVKEKKAAAFIYVPKDFTKNYMEDNKSSIELIADNNKQIDKGIVKNVLDSFNKNLQTTRIEELEIKNIASSNSKISDTEMQNIIYKIENAQNYNAAITKVAADKNSKPIGIMQYEAIAMIVMFSILTAFELAHNIVDDKLNNTLARIKSTPTLDIQYALGKVSGIVLAIAIQMSIVMLISHLIFKVNFGNIFYIILTTLAYGFTIGAIVFCAGMGAKDHMSISSFASLILYGFSFLGGSFTSKENLPEILQTVQKLIPNGKAINCYLKICQGGNLSDIYLDLIGLIIIGLVFLIFSLKLYSERRNIINANTNHDKKSIKAAL